MCDDQVGHFDRLSFPLVIGELPRLLRNAERADREKLLKLVVEQVRLLNPPLCFCCGQKDATGKCGYGRCEGSICDDCTVNGLCKVCDGSYTTLFGRRRSRYRKEGQTR